jgi:hypothetical protein
MKFKFNLKNNKTYNEVGQNNPIRWKTLFCEQDGSFTDQSGWIKCKDFYNDTVAYFREGSVFSIYGYDNKIKKNDEGVYFLLRYVKDKKSFFHNMEIMNKQLQADLGCKVQWWDVDADTPDEVVILIPNELWETTYRISMVTMCIRLCNWGYKYKNWEDFWSTDAPVYKLEQAFTEFAKKNARTLGFKVKPGFEKYWWYFSKDFNSEAKPGTKGSTIHNNGVSEWSSGMEKA